MKREKLRMARLEKHLSQEDVGKYLKLSRSEYTKIENGRELKLSQAKLLSKFLNINIEML